MKKRILSLIIIVTMMVTLFPGVVASAMTPQEGANWALNQIGKRIDTDGKWGAQCVDLIVQYCKTNFNWNPQGSGNAEAYRTVKLPNSSWQRIKNTADFIPQPGDIAIWNPTSGNGYCGHVAIIISANINSFVSVDQNWYNANGTTGSPAAKVTHNYSNFWGVIRPPFSSGEIESEQIHSSTSETVRSGFYTLKNVASNKYMNVYNGKDENETPITMWAYDDSTDQQFNIVHKGSGKYKLYAVSSNNGTNRVVDIYRNGADPTAGQVVDLWTPNDDIAQLFYIVPLSDGSYVFELAAKNGYVIAPKNASAAGTDGSQLTLQKYTAASYQKWKFCNNNGKETYPVGPYSIDSYTVNTGGPTLRMRSGAGTNYSQVASIPDKTTLNITKISNNWGYSTYNGTSGWVCLDYMVYSPTIQSISMSNMPHTTTFFVGDELDTTDMVVTATYSNGSTKELISGFTTSYDFSTPGEKTVTVTYSGKTTSFTVQVVDPVIEDLSIATAAAKTNYYVGDALDTTGLSLLAKYNNGAEKNITSGFTTSYDFSTPGTKTVTVTYEGSSITYDVMVDNAGYSTVSAISNVNKAYWNDEIIVEINLNNVLNVYDGNLNIEYDSNVLKIETADVGTALNGHNSIINTEYDSNIIRLTFAGTAPLTEGNIATLRFRVISDKTDSTDVSIKDLNMYNDTGKDVTATSEDVNIAIGQYDYTITDLYLLNESDETITTIPSSGSFFAGIYFNKNNVDSERPCVVFAVYDEEEKLIAMKAVQTSRYSQGEGLNCETDILIPKDCDAPAYIKAFIWDSIENMQPLCRAYVFR